MNFDRKWSLIGASSAVALLALAVGCRGFFVNQPTSVTISPASPASLNPGGTQPFTALAAFSDGSSKDVTQSASWSSSNPCIVAIVTSGADAGHATDIGTGGSVTITAIYNGVTGTVTQGAPSGLTVTPCATTVTSHYPQALYHVNQTPVQFTVSGSNSAAWASNTPAVVSITSSGQASFLSVGTATITATGTQTASLFITVQP